MHQDYDIMQGKMISDPRVRSMYSGKRCATSAKGDDIVIIFSIVRPIKPNLSRLGRYIIIKRP